MGTLPASMASAVIFFSTSTFNTMLLVRVVVFSSHKNTSKISLSPFRLGPFPDPFTLRTMLSVVREVWLLEIATVFLCLPPSAPFMSFM